MEAPREALSVAAIPQSVESSPRPKQQHQHQKRMKEVAVMI
jgi:hypothetical protein